MTERKLIKCSYWETVLVLFWCSDSSIVGGRAAKGNGKSWLTLTLYLRQNCLPNTSTSSNCTEFQGKAEPWLHFAQLISFSFLHELSTYKIPVFFSLFTFDSNTNEYIIHTFIFFDDRVVYRLYSALFTLQRPVRHPPCWSLVSSQSLKDTKEKSHGHFLPIVRINKIRMTEMFSVPCLCAFSLRK